MFHITVKFIKMATHIDYLYRSECVYDGIFIRDHERIGLSFVESR